ncbi:protein CHLOROPLAST IMPORT APPARATUS 2-like isoform X1 [Gastrolobium bilobum]|uniref:protein CHLOROPLAST IMPORT APPARATUS 2-like isoform X1 n=1 Tax=Gastrolobium bilobum TaxID=150636 RepID=UPI002AB0BA3A|nr:protein CHLOROPLAST IMPORT APPARATUS 2-like isoform X1 [Gastrolobium bilobum]
MPLALNFRVFLFFYFIFYFWFVEPMASSLSGGGGRTYGFDFDVKKSSSTSTITSFTSSPSSTTISETTSNNSQRAISTKKPRTPRKRPNQTYNEAATLLSTAYPNLFSTENLKKPGRFTKPITETTNESSELFLPFRAYGYHNDDHFLFQNKPTFDNKVLKPRTCHGTCSGEITSRMVNSDELEYDSGEGFDCESILDEEIEEGIDSIMGSSVDDVNGGASCYHGGGGQRLSTSFGFGGKFSWVRALRQVDDANWWNFPAVDMLEISPGVKNTPTVAAAAEKKKKKKKAVKPKVELRDSSQGFLLKLNYDDVLNAWSDRGSPFADDCSGSGLPGNDFTDQIDLFANGAMREASMLRYKEKRRTRLSSKKLIRYQVRKVNADQRPRIKGRFIGRVNSSPEMHKDD